MGATLLLTGLVAAIVTSPIFDRVLTRHLALTCKVLCPILGVLWLSLIWAGKSICRAAVDFRADAFMSSETKQRWWPLCDHGPHRRVLAAHAPRRARARRGSDAQRGR